MDKMHFELLKEHCKIFAGGDKPNDFTEVKTNENIIPIYANGTDNEGLIGYTKIAKVKNIAITITARGSTGTVFLRTKPYTPIIRLINIIPDKTIDCEYLYYVLKNNFIRGIGSVQPQLTVPMIENIKIKIYDDIYKQKQIAKILKTIDNQIERNNDMVQKLQDLIQTIYSRWFYQFEFPNENEYPYKSNGGKFIYNKELKRNIPINWEVKKIPDIFDFLEGPGITKDKYSNIGQNFINIKCLENNFININNCNKINIKYLNEYEKYQLKNEDILVSTSGTLGVIGIVIKTNLPLLLNTSIIRFRPILNINFSYMYSYLTTNYFKKLLYQSATGSIQKNIGPTHLETFNILIPTQYILEKYNKIIYPIFKEICLINEQNIKLNNLKNKILPLLINEQLKI